MRIGHVALGRRSEAEADRFFVELLGCVRTRTRELPAELGALFFERAAPCRMIDYEREGLRFEVFVPERPSPPPDGYGHVCLVVDDRQALVVRVAAAGVTVLRIEREGREIVFLRDADGNLYEIQQAP
jgi:catechol 2,3-dioxygenase-like lactoylglutathione lyase family enzyme